MRHSVGGIAGAVLCMLLASPSAAQSSDVAATACADCVTIPALTPVRLELMADLGSKLSKTGDMFPLRLAEPIAVDGRTLIPAGTSGMGEVVHAKKSGGSGAGGELVLAARYLDVGGRRLRLRSMQQGPNGKSQMTEAVIASAFIGVAGLFVTGKNAVLPVGSLAVAKTAEPFVVPLEAVDAPPAGIS